MGQWRRSENWEMRGAAGGMGSGEEVETWRCGEQ